MLSKTSKEFRALILLQFTKQLIKHSGEIEISMLEDVLDKDSKTGMTQEKRKEIAKKISEKQQEEKKIKKQPIEVIEKKDLEKELRKPLPLLRQQRPVPTRPFPPRQIKRPVAKPMSQKQPMQKPKPQEPEIPLELQYLKPTPTDTEIDLGKLNALIRDPMVQTIICNGPDEYIVVQGRMGTKKTNIILNMDEVNEVIKKFSEASKIPSQEGLFKVAVGKLIFSAIISEVVSSKFTIRKMLNAPMAPRR